VTASYTAAAVAAGLLQPVLPDHLCQPLNVHALLPARQFVPARVRCFLDALEAHSRNDGRHNGRREPICGSAI
jgi:DNA-binding transcriptional LysR family regulator